VAPPPVRFHRIGKVPCRSLGPAAASSSPLPSHGAPHSVHVRALSSIFSPPRRCPVRPLREPALWALPPYLLHRLSALSAVTGSPDLTAAEIASHCPHRFFVFLGLGHCDRLFVRFQSRAHDDEGTEARM